MTSRHRGKSKPPSRKDSENMTVREKGDMPYRCADSCNQPIGPRAACAGLSPPGQPSVKIIHPGACAWISSGVKPLVFAIVPFHQIAVDFCVRAETG